MDSGFVPPGDSFMPDFDLCAGREASEVIWIMDRLLSLEITWQEGYPLSQTVFSSLYVDRLLNPDNKAPYTFSYGEQQDPSLSTEEHLVHTVLRAFCIGQVKSCDLVLHLIQSQNYYEEEDFVTHLFGRELLPKTGVIEAGHILSDALLWLQGADLAEGPRQALISRLQFRKDFLLSAGGDEPRWEALITVVPHIQQSHTLASAIPEAFSDKVQRQLATSTPPRPMLDLTWDEACQKWTKMFDDIVEAAHLTSPGICQSPASLQRATWSFSYREPQPNTYARAYFQDVLFGSDRVTEDMTHFDLLLTDIRDLVLAGDQLTDPESFQVEVTSDPRHICSQHIEGFMDKVFDEYLNLYRMVCQNRCRIRRTFTQAIPILYGIQSEAEKCDRIINAVTAVEPVAGGLGAPVLLQPLTSWTRYNKLQLMVWTVQLGFETDIYLPDELGDMYDLLFTFYLAQSTLLEHIDRFLLERMKRLTNTRHTRYIVETLASQDWLQSLKLRTSITSSLSRALSHLYALLQSVHIVNVPKRDYAEAQLLYDARMKPFLTIADADIPDLASVRQSPVSLDASSRAVNTELKSTRGFLGDLKKVTPQQGKYIGTEQQWKKEIKQWETTCVAIAVQTSQLARCCEKAGRKDVQAGDNLADVIEAAIPPPGKRYHDFWIVPQLKAKVKSSV